MATLKFVKRGGAAVATITEDDLAAHEWGQDVPELLPIVRQQELEMPRAISIVYVSSELDYQQGTQLAQRQVGESVNAISLQLPIVMSDAKGKQVADVNLYNAWQQRTALQGFAVSRKWSRLEPTDVVDVVKGDMTYRVRLIKKDEGAPGIIKFDGVLEDSVVYTQTGSASVPDGFTPQEVVVYADTLLRLLDVPLLRDEDDSNGFYATACGVTVDLWPGCSIMKSIDGGATFYLLDSLTLPSPIGAATTTLGDFHGGNVFDELNSVTVVMTNGTLSSTIEEAVLNGANGAVLGDEIIQFKTATLISASTYKLTGLLRGRRGTEWAMGAHTATDEFTLINAATWKRLAAPTAEIGLERDYKGVTTWQAVSEVTASQFTNHAVALKPYAPVLLGGGRDASGNLAIIWVRRTRIGGEWRDGVDVALGEASEMYDLEIWDAGYNTLKRTFSDLTTTSVTYTATEQASDFGTAQATVYARAYQKSATVGRGYKLEGAI